MSMGGPHFALRGAYPVQVARLLVWVSRKGTFYIQSTVDEHKAPGTLSWEFFCNE